MQRQFLRPWVGALCCYCALVFVPVSTASASFHLWRFTEFFSSEDGAVQFIELHCPAGFNGENLTGNKLLKSNGQTFTIPANLPSNQTSNKFFIFATDDFAALPGAVTPDYIIPDHFFDPLGDTLNFAGVDNFTFASGTLPLDGRMSLIRAGGTAVNTPTNFAGAIGEINLSPPDVPGDTDGNGTVDLEDLNNVRNNFGATGTGVLGDTNDDASVDLEDLNEVRNNFGASGAASVPEPAAAALCLVAAAPLMFGWRRARRTGSEQQ